MASLHQPSRALRRLALVSAAAAVAGQAAWGIAPMASASAAGSLVPGDLLVSTSVYQNTGSIVAGTTQLPPGCVGSACTAALTSSAYPQVFNNDSVDPSFGVTSPIILDELTPSGTQVGSIEVPNSSEAGVTSSSDQLVTSFSSKSELALNLSTGDDAVTFVGYQAPVGTVDVSNANTPGDIDPTNPASGAFYRDVAQLDTDGSFHFTESNAFSGDNGRAAILDDGPGGTGDYYAAGNAGNGSNPEPQGIVEGAGAQIITPANAPESAQTAGQPTPVANFNIAELGDATDKSAKDDNFRGLTVADNVLYVTKGSGSNGVDTVYFEDSSGTACPTGTGLPAANSTLPTASNLTFSTSDAALGLTMKNPGLTPTNLCILKGFPTSLASGATDASDYPFGLWFANPDTLYVADEGSGDNTYSAASNTYTAAAASTSAGLQKWVFDSTTQQWNLAYTLQSGLNLGQPYTVPGYPTGDNTGPGGTGLPWAPATDGLRNLTGQVNANGTVTLWAATSTVSGGGDQGADPNALVSITDQLNATAEPAGESFSTVVPATDATVVRGVSMTPGTGLTPPAETPEAPEAVLIPLSAAVIGGLFFWRRRRQAGQTTTI
jgi:hypothetical protein